MVTYYHATSYEKLTSILRNGLTAGADGCVYMTEKEADAVKFLIVRGIPKIVTLKIKIYKKDMDKIQETFDHSHAFFKCKAFGYFGNIPPKNITPSRKYDNI